MGSALHEPIKKYDNYLHVMEVTGGSFVRSLVNCYYMANSVNRLRLLEAFADYFQEYRNKYDRYYKDVEY